MHESTKPPLLFRMGRRLARAGIRGGHRLCRLAEQMGLMNTTVCYQLPGGIPFRVALSNPDNQWDEWDLLHYELPVITALSRILGQMTDVTLFDCGADIGTFSALACASTRTIRSICAFEPNPKVFDLLTRNIQALPVAGQAFPQAVGNTDSYGELVSPDYDKSAHARFIKSGKGDVQIVKIDSLQRGGRDVALKIDVEGSELEVIEGARQTIAAADRVAIVFEAHPWIAQRTGRGPLACVEYLSSIRPFSFMIAETGAPISQQQPTSEIDWSRNQNIVGSTVG